MIGDTLYVFLLLAVTVALFASDLLRLDVVAVLVVLVLMLGGILSPSEALSGFGDPLVLLLAGLFVVGEALFRTGVAFRISNWVTRAAGTSETRLLVLLMLVVAALSGFMSSTGTVAIFIPVAINLAAKAKSSPARLLLPISVASLIGGMLTLIGTPPNLVVTTELTRNNLVPFSFFSFTPIGLLILAVGIGYMVTVGRRLLPRDTGEKKEARSRLSLRDLTDAYRLNDQFHYLALGAGSSLAGKTLAQARVRTRYGVNLIGLERNGQVMPVLPQTELMPGDRIFAVGSPEQVKSFSQAEQLELLSLGERERKLVPQELGLVEVLISPRSRFIGSTLSELRFRERFGLTVLGILRLGQPIREDLINLPLAFGDSLLMGGGWRQIELLQREHGDFLVLTIPKEPWCCPAV